MVRHPGVTASQLSPRNGLAVIAAYRPRHYREAEGSDGNQNILGWPALLRLRTVEQQRAERAGRLLGAARAVPAGKPTPARCDFAERDVLLDAGMVDADRAVLRPAGLEGHAVIGVGRLDAVVVIEVDEHPVPGGACAVAAVVGPDHADARIVEIEIRRHLLAAVVRDRLRQFAGLPGVIAKANALAHRAGGAGELEAAGSAGTKPSICGRKAAGNRNRLSSAVGAVIA